MSDNKTPGKTKFKPRITSTPHIPDDSGYQSRLSDLSGESPNFLQKIRVDIDSSDSESESEESEIEEIIAVSYLAEI